MIASSQAIKQLEDCRMEFSRLCLPSMDFPIKKAMSRPRLDR